MKWRHDQCKDVIENSKDSIDIIWLTLIRSIRLSLFQKKKRKEKNRCGVSVYSNRPWLMTLVQPPFFTLICQRLDKVFLRLRYFVNCFLASKPSNSFQRNGGKCDYIYYGWFTWWCIDMTFITSHFQIQLSLCSTNSIFKIQTSFIPWIYNILWVDDILKMAADIARILTACTLGVHIPASHGFVAW